MGKRMEEQYNLEELKKRACLDIDNLGKLYQMHEATVGENSIKALQISNRIIELEERDVSKAYYTRAKDFEALGLVDKAMGDYEKAALFGSTYKKVESFVLHSLVRCAVVARRQGYMYYAYSLENKFYDVVNIGKCSKATLADLIEIAKFEENEELSIEISDFLKNKDINNFETYDSILSLQFMADNK